MSGSEADGDIASDVAVDDNLPEEVETEGEEAEAEPAESSARGGRGRGRGRGKAWRRGTGRGGRGGPRGGSQEPASGEESGEEQAAIGSGEEGTASREASPATVPAKRKRGGRNAASEEPEVGLRRNC